jgi:hypothetical protein
MRPRIARAFSPEPLPHILESFVSRPTNCRPGCSLLGELRGLQGFVPESCAVAI